MKFVHKNPLQKAMQVLKIMIIAGLALDVSSALARKPAVEPVQGISIDEYKEVSPSEDPGFNFSNDTRVPAQETRQDPAAKTEEATTNSVGWWPLLLLPAGLAFMMFMKLKGQGGQETAAPSNVYSLPERKKSEDKDDFKKAG